MPRFLVASLYFVLASVLAYPQYLRDTRLAADDVFGAATWASHELQFDDRDFAPWPEFNTSFLSYSGQRPVRLMQDPPIYVVPDFLSPEECDEIIQKGRPLLERSTVMDSSGASSAVSTVRTSSSGYFTSYEQVMFAHKRVEMLTGRRVESHEQLQLTQYQNTEKYDGHFDPFLVHTPSARTRLHTGGQRIVTVLTYLNDVSQGGETVFPLLDLKVAPRKGLALIFFPSTMDGRVDPMALHQALPAVDPKYVCQIWIRQRHLNDARTWHGPSMENLLLNKELAERQRRMLAFAEAAAAQRQSLMQNRLRGEEEVQQQRQQLLQNAGATAAASASDSTAQAIEVLGILRQEGVGHAAANSMMSPELALQTALVLQQRGIRDIGGRPIEEALQTGGWATVALSSALLQGGQSETQVATSNTAPLLRDISFVTAVLRGAVLHNGTAAAELPSVRRALTAMRLPQADELPLDEEDAPDVAPTVPITLLPTYWEPARPSEEAMHQTMKHYVLRWAERNGRNMGAAQLTAREDGEAELAVDGQLVSGTTSSSLGSSSSSRSVLPDPQLQQSVRRLVGRVTSSSQQQHQLQQPHSASQAHNLGSLHTLETGVLGHVQPTQQQQQQEAAPRIISLGARRARQQQQPPRILGPSPPSASDPDPLRDVTASALSAARGQEKHGGPRFFTAAPAQGLPTDTGARWQAEQQQPPQQWQQSDNRLLSVDATRQTGLQQAPMTGQGALAPATGKPAAAAGGGIVDIFEDAEVAAIYLAPPDLRLEERR